MRDPELRGLKVIAKRMRAAFESSDYTKRTEWIDSICDLVSSYGRHCRPDWPRQTPEAVAKRVCGYLASQNPARKGFVYEVLNRPLKQRPIRLRYLVLWFCSHTNTPSGRVERVLRYLDEMERRDVGAREAPKERRDVHAEGPPGEVSEGASAAHPSPDDIGQKEQATSQDELGRAGGASKAPGNEEGFGAAGAVKEKDLDRTGPGISHGTPGHKQRRQGDASPTHTRAGTSVGRQQETPRWHIRLLVAFGLVFGLLAIGVVLHSLGVFSQLEEPRQPPPSPLTQWHFDISAVQDAFGPGTPVVFTLTERGKGWEREIGPVSPPHPRIDARGRDEQGDFWLRCTSGSQEIALKFKRKDTLYTGGPTDTTDFTLLIGERWHTAHARLVRFREDGQEWHGVLGPLRGGDSISVLGPQGELVGEMKLLESCKQLVVPVSQCGQFTYQLQPRGNLGGASDASMLVYVPDHNVLLQSDLSPDIQGWDAIDELTGARLDGSLFKAQDAVTQEALAVGFIPSGDVPQRDYYLMKVDPSMMQSRKVLLRPHRVVCPLRCIDALKRDTVEEVTITCSGRVLYENRELVLPPPQDLKDLKGVLLQFRCPGYKDVILPLRQVGPELAKLGEGPYVVELERTHTNVVVIWSASGGMARVLGDTRFQAPQLLLREAEEALRAKCGPEGYKDVELYILKENGLIEGKDLSQPSYESADRLQAVLRRGDGETAADSIYQDTNFKGRFGRHTIVVVFFGDFDPPRVVDDGDRGIMHLHLAKLQREDDDDPYIKGFCQEAFDGVSYITVGDLEKMREDVQKLADDVAGKLRQHLGR